MGIDEVKATTPEQLEETFLQGLEKQPLPFEELRDIVAALGTIGDTGRADGCVDLFIEKLVDIKDGAGLIRLFDAVSRWRADDPVFQKAAEKALIQAFEDRGGQVLAKNAGFGKGIAFGQILARLKVLTGLKPGCFCYERTWGFGVVDRVDEFYERVFVNFTGKPGHSMALGYAGESLELVGDDHLMARKHKDPGGLQELVRNDPAEVVRTALRSFGPMSAPALQEVLTAHVLPAGEWKPFWDRARKALKEDPLVAIPSKRSDAIRLLIKPRDYGGEWFSILRNTTDTEKILELIGELESRSDVTALADAPRHAIAERLAFVIRAAEGKKPDLLARAAMIGKRLGLADVAGMDRAPDALLQPQDFLRATSDLSAREVESLLPYLAERDGAKTVQTILSTLADMTLTALNASVDLLVSSGSEDACAGRFRALLESRSGGVVVLCWLAKHPDRLEAWRLPAAGEIMFQMVDAMNERFSGERLRAQNQLRGVLEQKEWLVGMLERVGEVQREDLLAKVNESSAWEVSSRRQAMAAMIKLYPNLARVVASKTGEASSAGRKQRYTSVRTYRERAEEYRKLMEFEFPQNTRDIAHARSYGDLSENAEYETARQQQRILMRRQAELERELAEVRETDFTGFSIGRAGMGTCVDVRWPDGAVRPLTILGEWDRDDALGIISNSSRVAQLLEGHRAGDDVFLPGPDGDDVTCRITAIKGLSDDVKRWIPEAPPGASRTDSGRISGC